VPLAGGEERLPAAVAGPNARKIIIDDGGDPPTVHEKLDPVDPDVVPLLDDQVADDGVLLLRRARGHRRQEVAVAQPA
jgi:hypothetical protein